MRKFYLFASIILACLSVQSQPPLETVGNPTAPTSVASYTGWSNHGMVTYTGNAEVQNINPSNSQYASGGGNVYFTNSPETYFQISGIPPSPYHDGIDLNFEMFGYDVANLNELSLTISTDNGSTWASLPYQRFWGNFFPPTPWDYFVAHVSGNTSNIDVSKMQFKFTQTTLTKTFRIDDIRLTYYVLLPIKLTYFTATVANGQTMLNWSASTSSNKEFFIVEKSKDGVQFFNAAQQYAKGVGEYLYTCTDEFSRGNKIFYRLKMINADGKISYSKVVIVNSEVSKNEFIQAVYPTPTKDVLYVLLNKHTGKRINLSIVDLKGSQRIQNLLNEGITNYKINIQHLEAGTYYLIVDDLQTKETQKIIVTK